MRLMMPSRGSCASARAVIGAYWTRKASKFRARREHLVLGRALGDGELDAGVAEQLALERQVFVILVGDQDAGHRDPGDADERWEALRAANGTSVIDDWSIGLTA